VLTTATINRLRALYPQGQFEVRRFRPNIVVRPENDDAEFVESKWVGRELRIGDDVVLAITDHCPRCVMSTLPQRHLPKDSGILRKAARHNEVTRRRVCRSASRRESPARRHRDPRLSTNRAVDISRRWGVMSSESEMPTMSAERGAARHALRLTKLEHKLFRSNILPIAFGFPFGLSIVVPVNMPLPTKIVAQVLQPIDIAAEFGDDPGVAEIDAHVRFVMHSAIDRLARKRGCLSSAGALAAPKPPTRSARLSSRCNADADIARHRRADRGASGPFHVEDDRGHQGPHRRRPGRRADTPGACAGGVLNRKERSQPHPSRWRGAATNM
jgi:MOSC domain